MKMCSVFPGTPASNVQLQWSKFLPLVSEQGFQRFYDSDRTKDCGKVRFSLIRVVHNGGKIQWTPIEYPYKDYLAERDDSTRTWLQNTAFMEDHMKDYLLDGINFSRSGKLLKAPIKIPTQFMSTKTIE